ncbi:MAG TPA: YIP1 family protein [Candidatus Acidoferrales bacterium]|jgi:hypothetical protein|nr:YIP1 family protein [Candidatus Acidoferrales bacterium]
MAATTTAVPDQPQQISSFARIFGVLFSPGKTFEDIVRRPTWIVPLIILTILSIGVSSLLARKMDWRAYFQKMDAKQVSTWDQMADDKKEQLIETQMKWTSPITSAIGVVGPLILVLILTLVYWGAFNVLSGGGLKFSVPFAIVNYAQVPAMLGAILAIVVLALKPYGQVDPQTMTATNLAAFLPGNSAPWLTSLGASIDLFWIWCMILLAIGFSKANPRKISKGNAAAIVFGLWLLWVLIKVGWAALSSGGHSS